LGIWRSEQRLASYERLSQKRTLDHALVAFREAAAQPRSPEAQQLRVAAGFQRRATEVSVLRVWRQKTQTAVCQLNTAKRSYFRDAATAVLEQWYYSADEAAVRTADLRGFADRGAYYVATSSTLESWAKTARDTRRERLTRTYHFFRRQYKIQLATHCLAKWRRATHDSHAASYSADNVYGGTLRVELSQ
jgi:hypothetical protein